ncbi:MAG: DUF6776 family protein [Halopseudomonas sp.]|uniref:DUF6776 family protein n=1 Tax=Halopseudomonas sp. TaxID=2901191 RepID=UPI00300165D8
MIDFKRRRPLREHSVTIHPRDTKALRRWKRGVIILLLMLVPVSAWQGWEAAQRAHQPQELERQALVERQAQLVREVEEWRQRYHQLEVDLLVAKDAAVEGRETVHELEAQLFKVQQSLAQYQGVLAPSAMAPGLRIQAFELHGTETANVFRYKVMVSRVGNESDTVQARLQVHVVGEQDGKPATLGLDALSGATDENGLALDFRYFQVVPANSEEATLTLPEGFVPQQVKLIASKDDTTLVEQTFDWTVTGATP